jgi:hypothetical protein
MADMGPGLRRDGRMGKMRPRKVSILPAEALSRYPDPRRCEAKGNRRTRANLGLMQTRHPTSGNRLEGRAGDADAVRHLILTGGDIGRFHDPPLLHPEDGEIAVDIGRYTLRSKWYSRVEGR